MSSHQVATEFGLQFIESLPNEVSPPTELVEGDFSRVIGSWGKQQKLIPFAEENGVIHVAISNPANLSALDILRYCYQKPLKLYISTEDEIIRAINSVRTSLMSARDASLEQQESDDSQISDSLKIDLTDAEDDDAPIIRFVNTLIFRAASEGASDIHIEPYEDCLKIRFRIDGVLKDIGREERTYQAAILSRIKVMANLNIAEKRLPQDGRIGLRIASQDLDIRVSTVPTKYGERIVMRLLDKSKGSLELDTLGMSPNVKEMLEANIKKSHGIILVTGPTGSGKTTTLYAGLSSINSEDKNILTVEDPVEYELPGIGQMQVNPKINFTFASGLRSILRQDPDVIMVGEIRDLETVEIAIQASLTGHLVFSTLHTNDAPGAVTRLLDMGVEPFLISSSLLIVVAQRLVRKLCDDCKEEKSLSPAELKELNLTDSDLGNATVFSPKDGGCPSCQHSGFRGRTSIHELLTVTDDVRERIMERADASKIRASATGMDSLRRDGGLKVLRGITSIEEVIRVTQDEQA